MAFNIGSMVTGIIPYVTNLAIWLLVLPVILIIAFMILYIRRKRKFDTPVLEHIDLGNGKAGYKLLKGGWFKSKFLFGIWDYAGERIFLTTDKRQVQDLSTEDYHPSIFGRSGVIVIRKPDDAKVLIPISKIIIDNESKTEIMSIAPADFRDSSSNILRRTEEEMKKNWEKVIGYISMMVVAMIFLIVIILIIRFVNSRFDSLNKLMLDIAKISATAGATKSEAPLLFLIPRAFFKKKPQKEKNVN